MVRRALLLSALLAFPQAARSAPLLSFPSGRTDFADWMKAGGWQSKRDRPSGWTIEDGALRLVSTRDSVLIGTESGFPLEPGPEPLLRVTLKVTTVPRGTNLSRKAGDDAAFRLYLAFERGGGVIKPPNTLAYAWTEKDDAGTLIRSSYFSNLWYVSLGKGPTRQDRWTVVERDLAADYRRAFPKDASLPRLKGMLLKCDSNDTKTSAESKLASIELTRKENPR
jgi:hypothetical protein